MLALLDALYPLKWIHTVIPLLPINLVDILQSPWPFILGIHSQLQTKLEELYDLSDVLVVDLSRQKLYVP